MTLFDLFEYYGVDTKSLQFEFRKNLVEGLTEKEILKNKKETLKSMRRNDLILCQDIYSAERPHLKCKHLQIMDFDVNDEIGQTILYTEELA